MKQRIESFRHAFHGLRVVLTQEHNFQIHVFIALGVLLFSWYVRVTILEFILLIFVIGMVLVMEILNSAVERMLDLFKPRLHGYVKDIKDILAAGVFIAASVAFIVGAIIFIPYLWIIVHSLI